MPFLNDALQRMATGTVGSILSVPDAKKWFQSAFYKEALDNVVTYNAQVMRERRSRLPYVDAQTGIAQSDSYNWRKRSERQKGILPGQVYSYVPKRWRVEPKCHIEAKGQAKKEAKPAADGKAVVSPTSGLIQTLEGGVLTKRSSRIASRKDGADGAVAGGVVMSVGSKVVLESPGSSEQNEEESPDMDMDYLEDYDSDEEKRSHRKRKRPSSSRTRQPLTTSRSSRTSEHDKPFLCKLCKRRYKTVASLKAHTTQYHGREMSASASPIPQPIVPTPAPLPPPTAAANTAPISSISVPAPAHPAPDEKVPVFLRPPPNVQGKPIAKPNPICDFCLGDNNINKKSSRPEKLVSCADCGRSGHPSCMQFSSSLSVVVRTYRWQCIECKTCHFCGTSENDDQLLFCDDCDRGYHMYCLKPPIKEPPEGNWSCGMCLKPISQLTPTDVIPNLSQH